METEIVPRRKLIAGMAVLIPLTMVTIVQVIYAELPPLIPRETLFTKPAAMQNLRLSPDGRWLSYIARDAADVPQLWIRDLDGDSSRQLTRISAPGASSHFWAENGQIICYEQSKSAGPSLMALNLTSGKERVLIAPEKGRFGNPVTRPAAPDELLISARLPDAREDDVYRVNVMTGAFVLDTKNPGGVPGNQFFADKALRVLAVERNTADGGNEVLVRKDPSSPWSSWMTADSTYNLSVEGFSDDGTELLLRTEVGTDKVRLVARRLGDGKERVVASSNELDLENVLLHPLNGAVQAASFLEDPRRWQVIDRSLAADFRRIARFAPGRQLWITSRNRADTRWLIWLSDDHSSRQLYLWNRSSGRATLLFEEQPELTGLPLARVKPISFKARDGLRIHGYLTLPVGVPARRLPLVVWVHGGPYLRDGWGFDNIGQLFANRGYAFLRINYRGSRGFGRQFKLASFKQWGGTMQTDIVDGVDWLVRSGIADRTRMAIIGHSYGGYAALAGLTLTPDLFACGAASSTTANLLAFVSRFPKTPDNAWLRETIGDPDDPKEAELLRKVSPITLIDRLSKPVVIACGDKDDALPPGDLATFVSEAGKRGQQAVLVVYEGDGHFFRRENQLDYFARVETLFARHLGGRAQPLAGEKQEGSTGRVTTAGR